VKQKTQLAWNRAGQFSPKVTFTIEVGSYTIKTAENYKELLESFRLRFEVFKNDDLYCERGRKEFDKFDFSFDHILIYHNPTKSLIGTYRVSIPRHKTQSYTALEFDLSDFDFSNIRFMELGRACIKKEFRKGAVIGLLWKGISQYMNESKAEYLFGCSSIMGAEVWEAALTYNYLLENNQVSENHKTYPLKKYQIPFFESWLNYYRSPLNEAQKAKAEELIPPLLKSYLKTGAKIAGIPAVDKDFDCVDFLTILNREEISRKVKEKFKVLPT
jgi:putative hemolysin